LEGKNKTRKIFIKICVLRFHLKLSFAFFLKTYLFGREREKERAHTHEQGEGQRGRERERERIQAGSMLSGEPDVRLDFMTLRP